MPPPFQAESNERRRPAARLHQRTR